MKDEDKAVEGQSFYSEALTGSGTLLPGGGYGPPTPDPTVLRGGPGGERTTAGGVTRPHPEDTVPVAQIEGRDEKAIESGGKTPFTKKATGTSK